MALDLRPLSPGTREAFLSVLARGSEDAARCLCTAYHGADLAEPGPPRACRDRLLREGVSDGVLLCEDEAPLAWCQFGPLDSFAAIARRPPVTDGTWAVTCMVVVPEARGRGLAHALLEAVLAEVRTRGARRVLAFAHRLGPGYSSPLPELPESVCIAAGMTLHKDHAECPVYRIDFGDSRIP